MDTTRRLFGLFALALFTLATTPRPAAAQAPDFDTVPWVSLSCSAGDPAGDESPSAVDLVGDAAHPAAYYAHDASHLFFRFRVDGDPAGPGVFASYAWNVLVQVPSGNPFQYQYELSLNGKSETLEVWANTVAEDIDFSPLFNDAAEVNLATMPVGALARRLVATDGSAFGGQPDYFVDYAIPVATLVDHGVISGPADLDTTLFFPATATNSNNYNKGYQNCPFQPGASLAVDASVTPALVPANAPTPVAYSIAVRNDAPATARGVVVEHPALPAFLGTPAVSVSADDASVTWTVVGTNPLRVRVPDLPGGKTVTVTIHATATPDCNDASFASLATAFATNAPEVSDSAELTVNFAAGGCAPCANDAECDDANACTTDACVAGGCVATTLAGCAPCVVGADCADDGNPCTTETCDAGACTAIPAPTCTPCLADVDCADDGNPCTTETCDAGACMTIPSPTCAAPCVADADCADDGNPCTTETCDAGACTATPDPACTACTVDADCNDGDVCTTDACVAGACATTPIPDCDENPVEECTNGLDDDGDQLIDCADTDCAEAPGCKAVEVCGDCVDNDGDGLVDYQDPDCCAAPMPLEVRRLKLAPSRKAPHAMRLRVKAGYAAYTPAGFDPMGADTQLQVSDPSGTVLCQRIPAAAWTHRKPRSFRFKDKTGAMAGGLKRARFAMKRTGAIRFRTKGNAVLMGTTQGHDVKVTIGVGGQCSEAMTQLRAKRHAMVLP